MRRTQQTQGSISIEAVLIIPALLLFLALLLAIGRTAVVRADLHAAVVTGTRFAAMETSSSRGEAAAIQAIEDHLAREGVRCITVNLTVNTSALDLPPGQAGAVSATATCVVSLADLMAPGLPGSIRISTSFTTSIDPYINR
ncbi:MAG: hypothetical protein FWD55_03150 [Propionibacteriaceae bacterium]|nr:hypothetical protein [Propionibacteriaceae bacterium]